MTMQHINSHLTLDEAVQLGHKRRDWAGNKIADEFAGEAARQHQISRTEMESYQWAAATAMLVRERIATATLAALERQPKTVLAKEPKKKKNQATATIIAVSKSNHAVSNLGTNRLWCSRCNQCISKYQCNDKNGNGLSQTAGQEK